MARPSSPDWRTGDQPTEGPLAGSHSGGGPATLDLSLSTAENGERNDQDSKGETPPPPGVGRAGSGCARRSAERADGAVGHKLQVAPEVCSGQTTDLKSGGSDHVVWPE